jgi:bifunctional DNA-binding transcriptional regulator/antitoxin component of YhaV-PrlF toxin-antitoxin module
MSAITFASKVTENGTFTIPLDAFAELGVHPGDDIRIRIEAADDNRGAVDYDRIAAELLQEARCLSAQPGKPSNDPHEIAFGEILKAKYC